MFWSRSRSASIRNRSSAARRLTTRLTLESLEDRVVFSVNPGVSTTGLSQPLTATITLQAQSDQSTSTPGGGVYTSQVSALWEALSLTRNAEQAVPQLVPTFGTGNDALALQWQGSGAGSAGQCWSDISSARADLQQALVVYNEASQSSSPQQGELMNEGNQLVQQAQTLTNAAMGIWQTMFNDANTPSTTGQTQTTVTAPTNGGTTNPLQGQVQMNNAASSTTDNGGTGQPGTAVTDPATGGANTAPLQAQVQQNNGTGSTTDNGGTGQPGTFTTDPTTGGANSAPLQAQVQQNNGTGGTSQNTTPTTGPTTDGGGSTTGQPGTGVTAPTTGNTNTPIQGHLQQNDGTGSPTQGSTPTTGPTTDGAGSTPGQPGTFVTAPTPGNTNPPLNGEITVIGKVGPATGGSTPTTGPTTGQGGTGVTAPTTGPATSDATQGQGPLIAQNVPGLGPTFVDNEGNIRDTNTGNIVGHVPQGGTTSLPTEGGSDQQPAPHTLQRLGGKDPGNTGYGEDPGNSGSKTIKDHAALDSWLGSAWNTLMTGLGNGKRATEAAGKGSTKQAQTSRTGTDPTTNNVDNAHNTQIGRNHSTYFGSNANGQGFGNTGGSINQGARGGFHSYGH
jgi:hypothetical protein